MSWLLVVWLCAFFFIVGVCAAKDGPTHRVDLLERRIEDYESYKIARGAIKPDQVEEFTKRVDTTSDSGIIRRGNTISFATERPPADAPYAEPAPDDQDEVKS